ncbi:tail fiber domain-containing protein, partial [Escherichia coli]|nr:tail fiber domain-containing protein [Escherichia coli]
VQVARESDDRITALEEENAELRQRLSAIDAALASK